MKNTLYAIHRDGARLYLPRWDANGEIIASKLPTAAVTITSEGMTFPPGSIWIRKPRSVELRPGWRFADTKPSAEAREFGKRIRTKPKRTRRYCVMCTKLFLAKRQDARLCSQSCRRRAARAGPTATDNVKFSVDGDSLACLQAFDITRDTTRHNDEPRNREFAIWSPPCGIDRL